MFTLKCDNCNNIIHFPTGVVVMDVQDKWSFQPNDKGIMKIECCECDNEVEIYY